MSVSGTVKYLADFTNTKALSLSTGQEVVSVEGKAEFSDGTGANQLKIIYDNVRTVNAAPETIDLTATLSDIYGTLLALTKIRGIIIHNLSTTAAQILTVSGNWSGDLMGGTLPTIEVHPSGWFAWISPVDAATITNTTQDQLTVNPGAANISYRLIILGVL